MFYEYLKIFKDNQSHHVKEIRSLLASVFKLSKEECEQLVPSRAQTTFENRCGWCTSYLYRSGLLLRVARGTCYYSPGLCPEPRWGFAPVLSSQYEMHFVSRSCRLSNSFISFAHWALWFSPFTGWRKPSAPHQRTESFESLNIFRWYKLFELPDY